MYEYGNKRKLEIDQRIVAFVDIGHSKTSIFVANFTAVPNVNQT
jgi:hypothetical protein